MNPSFPDLLRTLIARRNVLQKTLAAEMGINETTLSRFVNGVRVPLSDQVEDLARVLSLTEAELTEFHAAWQAFQDETAKFGLRRRSKPQDMEQRTKERSALGGMRGLDPEAPLSLRAIDYLRRLQGAAERRGVPPYLSQLKLIDLWRDARVAEVSKHRLGEPIEMPAGVARYWEEDMLRFEPNRHAESPEPGRRWDDVRRQYRRVMVIGDAGLGKTTLLLGDAFQSAIEAQAELLRENAKVTEVELPVVARFDDLAERLSAGLSLPQAIAESALGAGRDDSSWLTDHLTLNRALILLDGLDEVPWAKGKDDGSGRDVIERAFNAFVESDGVARWRIVATSRSQGYRPPWRLQPSVEEVELELLPIAAITVGGTLRRWLADDPGLGNAAQAYLDANPSLKSLGRSPLFLTFLYVMIRAAGTNGLDRLPRSRADLLEGVVTELVRGQWRDRARERRDRPGALEATLRRIETVALDLAIDERGWLTTFGADRIYAAVEGADPEQTLDDLILELGIFVQVSRPGWGEVAPYAFLHRSLHEYLVARALSHGPPTEAIVTVSNHLWFEPEWDQVIVMLASRLPNPNPLIARLLAEPHDAIYQMSLLAARCVLDADDQAIERTHLQAIAGRCGEALRSRSLLNQRRAAGVGGALPTNRLAREGLGQLRHLSDASEGWFALFPRMRFPGALPELLEGSQSPLASVRRAAAMGLGAQTDEGAGMRLLDLLWDSDPWVAESAAAALATHGSDLVVGELIRFVVDATWRDRYGAGEGAFSVSRGAWAAATAAAATLGTILRGKSDRLLALASATSPEVRELAAVAFASAFGSIADSGLATLLADPEHSVRTRALSALDGRTIDPEALPELTTRLQALASGTGEAERIAVLSVLASLSGQLPEALVHLLNARPSDPGSDDRDSLGRRLRDVLSENDVLTLSQSDSSWVRTLAAGMLGGRGAQAEVRLREVLASPNEEYWVTRQQAALTLGAVRGAEARTTLESALGIDPSPAVRQAAAEALGKVRSLASVPSLIRALDNPTEDQYVRGAAATSLALIGGESAEEALQRHPSEELPGNDLRIEVLSSRLQRGDVAAFEELVTLSNSADLLWSGQAYAVLAGLSPGLARRPDWIRLRKLFAASTENHGYSPGFAVRVMVSLATEAVKEKLSTTGQGVRERLFGTRRPPRERVPEVAPLAHVQKQDEPESSSREGVRRFTTGRHSDDWDGVMNWIEANRANAIVWRLQERNWEAWCEGKCLGEFGDEETARAALARSLSRD